MNGQLFGWSSERCRKLDLARCKPWKARPTLRSPIRFPTRLIALIVLALGSASAFAQQDSGSDQSGSGGELDFLFQDNQSGQAAEQPTASEAPETTADQKQQASGQDEGEQASGQDEGESELVEAEQKKGPKAPTRAETVASTSRLVGEIVVTATRREQRLTDVAIAIQALSGAKLDALGIDEVADLQAQIPTLNIGASASFATLFLRGLGTDSFLSSDPLVAYYVDGTYFPFALGLSQPFGKVKRIEVLKGPQGTTFGRNAVAGLIHVITEKPQLDEWGGELQLKYGEFNKAGARLYATGPLTDELAVSGTYFYNERDSFGDLILGGNRVGEAVNGEGGRVKLRWKPTDWLDTNISYFKYEKMGPGERADSNADPSPLCVSLGCTPQGEHDFALSIPIDFFLENEVFTGLIAAETPYLDVKLRASDQFIQVNPDFDFDGTPAPGPVFQPRQFGDIQTAELQFLSNAGSPGSEWLEFVAGLYFYRATIGFNPLIVAVSSAVDPENFFESPGNLATPLDELPVDLPIGVPQLLGLVPFPQGTLNQETAVSTESYSIYGQATIEFTDWFSLILGGRFNNEQRSIEKIKTFIRNTDGSQTLILDASDGAQDTEGNPFPAETEDSVFDPKIGLVFHPFLSGWGPFSPSALLYFNYQQATAAGTYNLLPVASRSVYVDSTELAAYEIGFKDNLFDGILDFSIAFFYYDVEDIQSQFVALTAGGAVSLQNIPKTEIKGFDFSSQLRIFPSLINGLVFRLAGGYVDSEYIDFSSAQGFDPQTGLFRRDINATGGTTPYAPEVSYNAALSKTWDIWGGPLETTVNYYHTDEYFLTSDNNPNFKEDGYNTVSGRISYLYQPWQLRTTLFGRNLTDVDYSDGCICNDFGFVDSNGPPRIIGVEFSLKFD